MYVCMYVCMYVEMDGWVRKKKRTILFHIIFCEEKREKERKREREREITL